jgi:RHH-type proline utilization regulon transcriptional repressor/proline dehydrogenase/delta 1-pyrroline-5-carboxylate dehydrogenase
MDCLVIGDPADPRTDIGPVIDADALKMLKDHRARLQAEAKILHACIVPDAGNFFPPILAEVPSAGFLEREVFGPILHVVRYRPSDLSNLACSLAARRYGLTLGIHSRIEGFAAEVARLLPAGNTYVNRSMTGAVVGVQPFGGEGLSGTGPKAGGPHALLRYAVERATSINIAAQGGDPALLNL